MLTMKYILFILSILILSVPSLAQEEVPKEIHGGFHISKVNRIEKFWVIPPDRHGFMGSMGIRKFNYLRRIPPEERGEHYVVTWRYRGEELRGSLTLKFEYKTVNNPKELCVEEYLWSGIKKGTYKWTFRNIGRSFSREGKVDRWKVSLIYGDKIVAEKRSATWRAMEGS